MLKLDRRANPLATCALALFAIVACGGSPAEVVTPAAPPEAASLAGLVDEATLGEIEAATRSVQSSPRSASAWNHLAEIYEVNSLSAEAESAYLSAASLTPEDPKPIYRAAIAAELQGEPARAITTLDRVLELDPTYGPAWRRKGTWLLDLGRSQEARSAFEEAAQRLAGAPDASIGLARTALLEDDIEGALHHARTAARLAEKDPYVRLILGEALRRGGFSDEAAPHLKAGQGSRPSYRDPWSESISRRKNRDAELMAKAKEFESKRDYASALAAYDDVLSRRPDDTNALLRRGTVLLALDRTGDAVRHFEKATLKFPGDYELLVSQVSAIRRAGAEDEALLRVEAIIKRWPGRPAAFLIRGEIQNGLGRIGDARRSYRKAAEVAPKDLRPQMFEARMLLGRNRADEAAAILTAAIERTDVAPSMIFFQTALQAQLIAGAPPGEIDRTYRRAVEIHGDEAKKKLTKSGGR